MSQETQNNNALLIHLSAFSNLFIPLGNLIFPIVLWHAFKKDSPYVDHHGKEAINFNLSFFIYFITILIIFIASLVGVIFNLFQMNELNNPDQVFEILFSSSGTFISLFVLILLVIFKFVLIILAAIKAGQGELFRYPLTIRFIK
ncbi:MAG: DUF4870 domain-containing protein [Flavobacteriaceae bacterium]|jgi:uncharacterized Tic20 family protein|nr:DUF4870 domain-containing protein [Flavobacteriaceae bacterium]